jgi:hypothetical protein
MKKQRAVMIYGGGANLRAWIEEMKAKGYVVCLRDGHATAHDA